MAQPLQTCGQDQGVEKLTSTPRQFSLKSLFVATFAIAVLLETVRLIGPLFSIATLWETVRLIVPSVLGLAGLFLVVGLARTSMFERRARSIASMIAGAAYFELFFLPTVVLDDIMWLVACAFMLPFGAAHGYVAGKLLSGVPRSRTLHWQNRWGIGTTVAIVFLCALAMATPGHEMSLPIWASISLGLVVVGLPMAIAHSIQDAESTYHPPRSPHIHLSQKQHFVRREHQHRTKKSHG
jgi:hypothetical protein